jgi:hypothetical protein
VRAWILLQVKSPHAVARNLYEKLKDEGKTDERDYVVVRADVIEYQYNIMIPVDARSDKDLQFVYERILEITGASDHTSLRVVGHTPFPPHNAQGYITQEEAEQGKARGIKPGRQSNSPGENAWG